MKTAQRTVVKRAALGRRGETVACRVLNGRGYGVLKASCKYMCGGKRPPLEATGRVPVPPDFAAPHGKRVWLETKWKKEATLHHNTGRWEHGIDRRKWNTYQDIEDRRDVTVFLLVMEQASRSFLLCSLDDLSGVVRYGSGMGSDMVYFPRTAFTEIGTFDGEVD